MKIFSISILRILLFFSLEAFLWWIPHFHHISLSPGRGKAAVSPRRTLHFCKYLQPPPLHPLLPFNTKTPHKKHPSSPYIIKPGFCCMNCEFTLIPHLGILSLTVEGSNCAEREFWKHIGNINICVKTYCRKSKSEQRDHLAHQANEQIIICSFWTSQGSCPSHEPGKGFLI